MVDNQSAPSDVDEGRMTLIDHLTELRNRLGIAFAAFILLFLVSVAPWPGTASNSIAYYVFVFLQAPLAEILEAKGGGGGQPFFAQAGGSDVTGLEKVKEIAFNFTNEG